MFLLAIAIAAGRAQALELKSLNGFEKVEGAPGTFLSEAGEAERSSLLIVSELAESISAKELDDLAFQKLYRSGLAQIYSTKKLKKIQIAAAQKIRIKNRSGLLFRSNFEEGSQSSKQITNFVLILPVGASRAVHIDLSGPATRSSGEWKAVLGSLEAALP